MGVLVLNPQNCLQNPVYSRQALLSPSRMKFPQNRNPSSNKAKRPEPNRRKRSPNSSPPPRTPAAPNPTAPSKNLVMGQVKILKRGEQLTKTTPQEKVQRPTRMEGKAVEDLDLGSTDRLGPDPELVPTQIRLVDLKRASGFYAGSAFITSPHPSSLPLPAFFMKKSVDENNDHACSDLRKLLGLHL